MAQITFDPNNPDDIKLVQQLLGAPVTVTTAPTAQAPDDTAAEEQVQTHVSGTTDCHGMTWDAEIHSDPATINADGSWRARRGRKDEYDAAIAAHNNGKNAAAGHAMTQGAPAPATATTGMPSMPSMPAAPAPTHPVAPVDYEDMARRFVGMINDGEIADFALVYNDLGVSFDDIDTNQTSIDRLWKYMNALDAGGNHAACVQAAMS